MAKCLVLGANGFIGSHLVDALVAAGDHVRAFDKFGNDNPRFLTSPQIEIVPGDFLNRADLKKAVSSMDFVFHFISTTNPATAENNPLIDVETNVKMSIELFEECVSAGIKKVIFPSTGGAIYGDIKEGVALDETVLPRPVSPYAIGKLTIEHYLRYFKKKFDLDSVTFRVSNPYGERQSLVSRQGVIPIFLQHIAAGEPITVLDDGSMVRDYLYVGDVAKLVVAAYREARYPLYNLGSGKGASVNELIDVIREVTSKTFKIDHKPKPPTFLESVVLDTTRYQQEFKLTPETDLKEGIARTWEYVKFINKEH